MGLAERATTLRQAASGRKAYITGASMVLMGLYGFLTGQAPTYDNPMPVPPEQALSLILEGIGIIALRAGISKVGL